VHSHYIAPALLFTSFLISPCFADGEAANPKQMPLQPLTRASAAQILANTDSIAEDLIRQIKSLRNPGEAAVVDDLHDVIANSSDWEWYSRDHGILLAIPVKERLGLHTSYSGEKVLADVVRRLIHQRGWGNPPVQVVLIEPKYPTVARSYVVENSTGYPAGYPAGRICSCR